MKFSHSLLFSTVPEWQSHYVSYDALKATIYKIEKDQAVSLHSNIGNSNQASSHPSGLEPAQSDSSTNELQDHDNNESTGLLQNHDDEHPGKDLPRADNSQTLSASDRMFLELLSQELSKVEQFYQSKQHELIDELNGLTNEIETIEKQGMQLLQETVDESAHLEERAIDDEDEEDDDDDDDEEHDENRRQDGLSTNQPSSKRQQLLKSATIFGILPILGFSSSKTSRSRRSKSLSRLRGSSKNPTPRRVSKNTNSHLIDVNTAVARPGSPTSPLASRRRSVSPEVSSRVTQAGSSQQRLGISKWIPHQPKTSRSLSLGSQGHRKRSQQSASTLNLAEFWMSNLEFIHDSRVFFKRRITH